MPCRKWFFRLLSILILVSLVSACSNCKKECRAQYDRGYNDGERVGYDIGYKRGKSVGYGEGKADGYVQGETKGLIDGQKQGYMDGTRALIKDSFLPTLGTSILILILAVIIFSFHKTIGTAFYSFVRM